MCFAKRIGNGTSALYVIRHNICYFPLFYGSNLLTKIKVHKGILQKGLLLSLCTLISCISACTLRNWSRGCGLHVADDSFLLRS